jgi:hypothetical protein
MFPELEECTAGNLCGLIRRNGFDLSDGILQKARVALGQTIDADLNDAVYLHIQSVLENELQSFSERYWTLDPTERDEIYQRISKNAIVYPRLRIQLATLQTGLNHRCTENSDATVEGELTRLFYQTFPLSCSERSIVIAEYFDRNPNIQQRMIRGKIDLVIPSELRSLDGVLADQLLSYGLPECRVFTHKRSRELDKAALRNQLIGWTIAVSAIASVIVAMILLSKMD